MKKKLLLLLGAGSSVEQGLPSTLELDKAVAKWAAEFARNKGPDPIDAFTPLLRTDFYGRLWRNRATYNDGLSVDQRAFLDARTQPNYERVLGDLHALMNGVLPKPFGDPILRAVPSLGVLADLGIAPESGPLDQHGSNKVFFAVQGQLQHLCQRLAQRIRGSSHVFEFEAERGMDGGRHEAYRGLLAGLASEFDLGIYNLNYDSVALTARPDAFVGFDRKRGPFLASEVLRRKEWDFLYHLHGSIHHRLYEGSHTMEDPDFGARLVWHEDLTQQGDGQDWEDVVHLTTRSDEKRLLLTTLVAGGWKLDQLQEEPFLTLYSCLPRHAYEADAIVIGGYGFGDSHVNSVLQNVLRAKAARGGRPPVLVLDYDGRRRATVARSDAWAVGLSKALRVPAPTFRTPAHRGQKQWTEVPDVVPAGEFEQSLHSPVATWNHGFLAAGERLPQILRWLDGERAAL